MRTLIFACFLLVSMIMPVSALEFAPPEVPMSGEELMPENTDSLAEGLSSLLRKAFAKLHPQISSAVRISTTVLCTVLLLSVLQTLTGPSKRFTEIGGTVLIAALLLESTDSLIRLGAETVVELSEYGKLLLPVMTAGLAAQGAVTTSAALYTGTVAFDMVLSSIISGLLVPLVYVFLVVSAANSATAEGVLKRIRDFVKWLINWTLKTVLTVFTAYISLTGVVSGTTDALTLKATKMTISSVVPVVGGILSDASEAVLISTAVMKNAAGIYGILAVLSVFLSPFLRIGSHYIVFKVTAALCGIYGPKQATELIDDFSAAMGFLLAMTGAVCLMLLISTVCFMRGIT